MVSFIRLIMLVSMSFYQCTGSQNNQSNQNPMACKIIKKVALGHCARGTKNCLKCKEAYHQKYCMLDICPEGDYARPTTEVVIDGVKKYIVYDVLKVFENYQEAFQYSVNEKIQFIDEPFDENDKYFEKIRKSLPENWLMKIENDNLIIECKDAIISMYENKINAPLTMETEEQKIKRIKEFGKPDTARIVFTIENKWFIERYDKLKKDNEVIYTQISQLPAKYKIENLRNRFSKMYDSEFKAQTEEDQKKIDEYLKEKNELLKNVKPLPEYYSEKYTIYFTKIQGIDDEFNTVFPFNTTENTYKIYNPIKDILEKYEKE